MPPDENHNYSPPSSRSNGHHPSYRNRHGRHSSNGHDRGGTQNAPRERSPNAPRERSHSPSHLQSSARYSSAIALQHGRAIPRRVTVFDDLMITMMLMSLRKNFQKKKEIVVWNADILPSKRWTTLCQISSSEWGRKVARL
ncbi:uncharacterized protein C8R40DRAFT_1108125 [Lentinula edodes]|uniref:uncharacterized protein n=1 Tax=Lentinula edodes TaxID=5353 RepID=UPI001E8CCF24|nr:uncharacterized protein C8R40DRAFT_1108125 [Lentinula edodes]KAH7874317.1 hypothetical protein C8R40DRAFT_1108125 [Lentinula edodes]